MIEFSWSFCFILHLLLVVVVCFCWISSISYCSELSVYTSLFHPSTAFEVESEWQTPSHPHTWRWTLELNYLSLHKVLHFFNLKSNPVLSSYLCSTYLLAMCISSLYSVHTFNQIKNILFPCTSRYNSF